MGSAARRAEDIVGSSEGMDALGRLGGRCAGHGAGGRRADAGRQAGELAGAAWGRTAGRTLARAVGLLGGGRNLLAGLAAGRGRETRHAVAFGALDGTGGIVVEVAVGIETGQSLGGHGEKNRRDAGSNMRESAAEAQTPAPSDSTTARRPLVVRPGNPPGVGTEWRRGESNPRPEAFRPEPLRA